MAQIVKLRRSSVSGQKPTNTTLQLGELALNTVDGKVFFAKSGSLGPTVEELVSTNTINTGSINISGSINLEGNQTITGSLYSTNIISGSQIWGDGSNLINIPLSGVTNLVTISGSFDNRINEITSSLDSINNFSSSVVLTSQTSSMTVMSASYALTASYALNASGGSIISDGAYTTLTQTIPSTTWSFTHNLGQKYPIFQVFDNLDNVIIPTQITAVTSDTATITFSSPQSGRVIASLGSGPGGMTQFFESSATWSLNHNMGTDYPIVTVYNNNRKIIFPQEINSIDGNNIDVYFSVPVSGYLNVAKGGHIISGSVGFTNLDLTNSNIVSSSVQVADYGYAITGSNTFIGDQGITGSLNIRKAKIDSTCVTVSSVTNQTIFDLHMFDGANFDYVIKNGSNMRGGVIMSVWDGTNVRYNETSTTDLGDTSGVTFSVTGTGLLRVSTISGTWSIEVLYRALSCS